MSSHQALRSLIVVMAAWRTPVQNANIPGSLMEPGMFGNGPGGDVRDADPAVRSGPRLVVRGGRFRNRPGRRRFAGHAAGVRRPPGTGSISGTGFPPGSGAGTCRRRCIPLFSHEFSRTAGESGRQGITNGPSTSHQ